MRSSFLSLLLIFTVCFAIACNKTDEQQPQLSASQQLPDTLVVTDGWARPAGKGATSAAYFTIKNGTNTADTLLTIQTKAAGMAEIHETYKGEGGMMGMRPAGTIIIQPDSSFVLQPGGYHLMLMHLNRKLAKGDSLQLSLTFSLSGLHTVAIPVGSNSK